eukprot:GFYU01010854.1.p1 GENE.GFYU01010854.1~~GFYU01010854.1.p1  ORF type:complete len:353 (-),score=60.95 GFYU01010854.1:41-1033(-)
MGDGPVQEQLMQTRLKLRQAERELNKERENVAFLKEQFAVMGLDAGGGGGLAAPVGGSACAIIPIDPDELDCQDQIAGGGFGIVYRGEWRGTEVAIKKNFDPNVGHEERREFEEEVKWLSSIRHPNIIEYMGSSSTIPNLSIVTELAPYGTLSELLHERRTKLTELQAVRIALGVAKALQFLHTNRPVIVHRDINSRNVLIFEWPVGIKIIDFGLARQVSDCVPSSGNVKGTLPYMGPELLDNQRYNEKTDVYAFGILLNEILTAEIPFGGLEYSEVKDLINQGHRPPLPEKCHPELVSLIQKCWPTEMSQRIPMKTVLSTLRDIEASLC